MRNPRVDAGGGAVFSVTGLALPEGEDPLGIWSLHQPGIASFALGEVAGTETKDAVAGLSWYIDLPASDKAARPQLRRRIAEVERRMAYLTEVEQRLTLLEPGGGGSAVAFSALETTPSGDATPEDELLAVVDALSTVAGPPGPVTAFALGEGGTPLQRRLFDQGRALFDQFKRLVTNFASVETDIEGAGVAVTTVDWTGDVQTAWAASTRPAAMSLHQEAVRLAVTSRLAWLKLMGVVVAGALGLAVKASVPGGQFLLIPAVYQYVRRMLKAWKQVQA